MPAGPGQDPSPALCRKHRDTGSNGVGVPLRPVNRKGYWRDIKALKGTPQWQRWLWPAYLPRTTACQYSAR